MLSDFYRDSQDRRVSIEMSCGLLLRIHGRKIGIREVQIGWSNEAF